MTLTPDTITGPFAALLAGMVTSIHCLGMCGPLMCSVCASQKGTPSWKMILSYHGMRLLSYSLCGALAGWLGSQIGSFFESPLIHWLPIAFAIGLIAIAFRMDSWIPSLPLTNFTQRLWPVLIRKTNPVMLPALTGLATPLFPCGPLYILLSISTFSGSMLAGAQIMLFFSLGTILLLSVVQFQWIKIRERFSDKTIRHAQIAIALLSAGILIWRTLYGPETISSQAHCCH